MQAIDSVNGQLQLSLLLINHNLLQLVYFFLLLKIVYIIEDTQVISQDRNCQMSTVIIIFSIHLAIFLCDMIGG